MKNGNEMSKEELRSALQHARDELSNSLIASDLHTQEMELKSDYEYKALSLDLLDVVDFFDAIKWFFAGYLGFGVSSMLILIILGFDPELLNLILPLSVIVGILCPIVIPRIADKKLDKLTEETAERLREINQQKYEYISQHLDVYGFIPPKYVDKTKISKLISYLDNMRANNLQEALNLLEAEMAHNCEF
ncbi:hypothetical protein [Butyrivibrio sp. YAB3001]|uniref:hypothetical protein n=1 Tax=Butyrivibrio sp. YAB3001 TaxID=1520812 RepID=UPI0008F62E25|nr:hypothetical protein [Butyrivibrio sp. YAB3001]SFB81788.1 hypothetical protein SAMN02910398_00730 [Butyrivibrio sp. YAB3001]